MNWPEDDTEQEFTKEELEDMQADFDAFLARKMKPAKDIAILRAALEQLRGHLTCSSGGHHYCPNCDRSLHATIIDVALKETEQ